MNWGEFWGTAATAATGNPYIGMAVNSGINWVHDDKGTDSKPKKTSDNVGQLASIGLQAYAAKKSRKKQAQATQNAGKLDLGYLRQEAENNGFNPLTVLQSTGGAGSTKSANAGLLASSQFWATYADGLGELNNRQYEQGLIDKNKKPEKTEREKFIDRYRVPLLVPVTTGGMDGETNVSYMTINPELMETRMSELMGSMFVQGIQYTYQNGVNFQGFLDAVKGLPPAFTKSLENLYELFDGEVPTEKELKSAVAKELGKQGADMLGEYLQGKLPKKKPSIKSSVLPEHEYEYNMYDDTYKKK